MERICQIRYVMKVVCATIALMGISMPLMAEEDSHMTWELTPERQMQLRTMQENFDYPAIARAYADFMIKYGRDCYGKVHSPLFITVLNRKTGKPFRAPYPHVIAKPHAPGLRRDHKMRPYDRTYEGSNPLQDIPLYGLLYRLSEQTGNPQFAEEANKSIAWFLENAQESSGLFPWGSHRYYHTEMDRGVYSAGRYGGHEYNFVWPYWDQNPAALKRFAHGLWNNHIKDKKTGHFNRHSDAAGGGMEFPRAGSCFLDIWARQYGRGGDPEMKQAIRTLLKLYRSMRDPETGAMAWCTVSGADRREVANLHMNLFMATTLQDASAFVEKRDPALAEEMRGFARFIDDEYLSNDYSKILDIAGKGILGWYNLTERVCMPKGLTPPPKGVDTSVGFPLKMPDGGPAASLYYLAPWFPGRSYAEFALLLRDRYERCEDRHKPTYRRALLDVADIYMTIGPEVQFAQYPDNISDVVEVLRYAYALTNNAAYLHRSDQVMRVGISIFFDETSPLPKITNFDDWYESSSKNESSVAIIRQMLELSLDLEALPEGKRSAPVVKGQKRDGAWHAKIDDATPDLVVTYGHEGEHEFYVSQIKSAEHLQLTLSDTITRIPTTKEADELNGRMQKFTGKGHTAGNIPYGGFKDVPRRVTLGIRNAGKNTALIHATAVLHDTYHDNGKVLREKTLGPGEQGVFVFASPSNKWIRKLTIRSQSGSPISVESIAIAMCTRSLLQKQHAQQGAQGDAVNRAP